MIKFNIDQKINEEKIIIRGGCRYIFKKGIGFGQKTGYVLPSHGDIGCKCNGCSLFELQTELGKSGYFLSRVENIK